MNNFVAFSDKQSSRWIYTDLKSKQYLFTSINGKQSIKPLQQKVVIDGKQLYNYYHRCGYAAYYQQCQNNHKIQRICVDQSCIQHSLFCSQQTCSKNKLHIHCCSIPWISMLQIIKTKADQFQNYFLSYVLGKDFDINSINLRWYENTHNFIHSQIISYFRSMLQKIYNNKNLMGKYAHKIMVQAKTLKMQDHINVKQLLKQLQANYRIVLKNQLLDNYQYMQNQRYKIQSSNNTQWKKEEDRNIQKDKQRQEQLKIQMNYQEMLNKLRKMLLSQSNQSNNENISVQRNLQYLSEMAQNQNLINGQTYYYNQEEYLEDDDEEQEVGENTIKKSNQKGKKYHSNWQEESNPNAFDEGKTQKGNIHENKGSFTFGKKL